MNALRRRAVLRRATCLIVERNGEYLVGYSGFCPRWSISPYDGWHTRDIVQAKMVAGKVKGKVFLFNPIVNQLAELEGKNGHD